MYDKAYILFGISEDQTLVVFIECHESELHIDTKITVEDFRMLLKMQHLNLFYTIIVKKLGEYSRNQPEPDEDTNYRYSPDIYKWLSGAF